MVDIWSMDIRWKLGRNSIENCSLLFRINFDRWIFDVRIIFDKSRVIYQDTRVLW